MSIFNSSRARSLAIWGAVALFVFLANQASAQTGKAKVVARPVAGKATADPATVALRRSLQRLYPNTQFGAITRSPIAGIWEVWMGSNVAYVGDDGRYFLFGHLYDMKLQRDLTAARKDPDGAKDQSQATQLQFKDLPLELAIVTKRGTGARKLAVFSDPDCPYCRQLEATLEGLQDVTVYTFLFPIEALHPGATEKSARVWCASDRTEAWSTLMKTGAVPPSAVLNSPCSTPIEAIAALANSSGINGTPFLLFENGVRAAGALDNQAIEQRFGAR